MVAECEEWLCWLFLVMVVVVVNRGAATRAQAKAQRALAERGGPVCVPRHSRADAPGG